MESEEGMENGKINTRSESKVYFNTETYINL